MQAPFPIIPLISKQETNQNINSEFAIPFEIQRVMANGNTMFMIELSQQLKLSYTLPTIALQIASRFYHKRCYINYDRFLILCASLILAAKFKDFQLRVKTVIFAFHKVINLRTGNLNPINQEKLQRIRNEICSAQTQILRTLQYEIDCTTPHDYLRRYFDICFDPTCPKKKLIHDTTRILIIDSNRAQLSLYYNSGTIFVACLLIASAYSSTRPYLYLRKSPSTVASENNTGNDQTSEEQLYKMWLQIISSGGVKINEEDVKNCIKDLNEINYIRHP